MGVGVASATTGATVGVGAGPGVGLGSKGTMGSVVLTGPADARRLGDARGQLARVAAAGFEARAGKRQPQAEERQETQELARGGFQENDDLARVHPVEKAKGY